MYWWGTQSKEIPRENVLNEFSDANGCEYGHISDIDQDLKIYSLLFIICIIHCTKQQNDNE